MFEIISIAAILSNFIPLLIVLMKKLWKDNFFMLFASYWLIGGLVNMTDFIPQLSGDARTYITMIYNMLDIPFILAIFHFTTISIMVKRYTSFALILFVSFEIINAVINGLNSDSLKYSLGSGIILVISVLGWEIIRYLQKIEHSNRQTAKIYIYAALLFEYGTFIVIYIFDYFIPVTDREDTFLIYYISTLVAILIASCGYLAVKIKKNSTQEYYNTAKGMEW